MKPTYAIICDARQGKDLGIDTLAMVDRKKGHNDYWTSDDPNLIMRFFNSETAHRVASRLQHNDPRVVEYAYALGIIDQQKTNVKEALECKST